MIKEVWDELGLPVIPIVLILLAQSTWLFLDARKRGGMAWLWGLLGLIQFPWPTVIYLILRRLKARNK